MLIPFSRAAAAALIPMLLLPAACAPRALVPQGAGGLPDPGHAQRGDDVEYARLAAELPGFGGFVLEADTLVLLLVDPGVLPAAEERVRAVVEAWRPGTVISAVRTERASYGYSDLQNIYRRLVAAGLPAAEGVVASGIDLRGNRVIVQVAAAAQVASVERILHAAGVPREAVRIDVTGPIVF